MKKIFTLAAIAAIAIPASADTLDLPLDDLVSGWESSYDPATKTITFNSPWTGRGWWLSGGSLSDMSAWDQVVVEFEPCAANLQIVVEYEDANSSSSTGPANAGATKAVCELDAAYKNAVKQIYVQNSEAGTLTLTRAYLENGVVVDPNLLWEGEYTISGWNNGAEFTASKVEAGDVLEYTFTDAGADNAQVIIKGSDWKDLLGTFKINHADMALGTVQVGVTQEMLDNCGGKIFVQGDGNCVLTKVAKAGTYKSEGVLAYGARVCGNNAYFTIPEGTKYIDVKLSAKAEWLQICDSSWAEYEMECTESADGSVRTYTLTDEAIAKINEQRGIVFNGPAEVSVLEISTSTGSAVKAIESAADNGKYYNLQGIEVANPTAPGLYIHNGKKIVVK